jgi:hypothetical protein
MKKEKKFKLEKFEVAKLKNLKRISGGYKTTIDDNTRGNDDTIYTTTGGTSQDQQHSNGICVV